MRAIFINHCHPQYPHVCAMRMKNFAYAMAKRGHKIVLLTEALSFDSPELAVEKVKVDIIRHNWAEPFILPIKPKYDHILMKLRLGKLSFGVRQLVIFYKYLMMSGVFGDWREGVSIYYKVFTEIFKPEVIWATFGNTDCWNIAQDLSKKTNCPWVGDVKDNWRVFVPFGMSSLLVKRYSDIEKLTAFSDTHKVQIKGIFNKDATVVYSGFFKDQFIALAPTLLNRIMITGSLYDQQKLSILVDGILQWINCRPAISKKLEVRYAGSDTSLFLKSVEPLREHCEVVCDGYLPVKQLRELQANAWINAYVFNEKTLFHHKTLELLAAGRPIISIPSEGQELLSIAESVGVEIEMCAQPDKVSVVLESFFKNETPIVRSRKILEFSWEFQSKCLENILISAIGGK